MLGSLTRMPSLKRIEERNRVLSVAFICTAWTRWVNLLDIGQRQALEMQFLNACFVPFMNAAATSGLIIRGLFLQEESMADRCAVDSFWFNSLIMHCHAGDIT